MAKEYQLEIKTVRHSQFADEYEGRAGLAKLPYKMLLRQSEIRNGQLQSEIDELHDKVETLLARVAELEDENAGLRKGLLKEYTKEVRKEELYKGLRLQLKHDREINMHLRDANKDLIARLEKQEKK